MATDKIQIRAGKFIVTDKSVFADGYDKAAAAHGCCRRAYEGLECSLGCGDVPHGERLLEEYVINRWHLKIVGGKIIADTDGAGGYHGTFRLQDGTLFLYRGTGRCYAYFRDANFQGFLDQCGIDRIVKGDPSGDYVSPGVNPSPNYCYCNKLGVLTPSGLQGPGYSVYGIPEGSKWALVWRNSEYQMAGKSRHCELVTDQHISLSMQSEIRAAIAAAYPGAVSVWDIPRRNLWA